MSSSDPAKADGHKHALHRLSPAAQELLLNQSLMRHHHWPARASPLIGQQVNTHPVMDHRKSITPWKVPTALLYMLDRSYDIAMQ
eukprot:scaffold22086_cov15-Prasinocladus_malaysianus.AAC.1